MTHKPIGADDVTGELPAIVETRIHSWIDPIDAEIPTTPQDYGAAGDGVTDDTQAFQDMLDAGSPQMWVPPGTYSINATLIQTVGTVVLSEGATLRADTAMTTLWQVGTVSTSVNRSSLVGGIFDGNNLAVTPLRLFNFARLSVRDLKVFNAAGDAIVLGDPSTTGTPYEPLLENVNVWRPSSSPVPAGSRGIWVRRAGDGEYNNIQVVGSDIGVQADTGSNRFSHVHTWGYPGHLPSKNFYDTAFSNVYEACVADSGARGFQFDVSGAVMLGCRILSGEDVTADTMDGIYLATAAKITAIGTEFSGSGALHSMRTNVAAQTDYYGSIFYGGRTSFVTTVVPDGFYGVPLRGTGGVYLGGNTIAVGSGLWSGSGAPSNAVGANGDYFFRSGGSSTRVYFKVSGAWAPLLTAAGDIVNTPAGNIAATTVQAALNELDTEKVATTVLDTDGTLAANSDAKVATQKATKTAITAAIDGLIAAAPGTLDTLKELADALGDDPNFAGTVTTSLAGKQPIDADLTTIAALDSTTAGALVTDGSGWIRKTYAQLKTALALVKGDVGLGNVDNTDDATKQAATITAVLTSTITNGDTAHAPTGDAVYDQLALKADKVPMPTTGQYWFPISPTSASTANTLGNNTLRVAPFVVHNAVTLDRIGAEVLATIGEAGSKFRLGIYADNGSGVPGALVVDAGQIAGDSAAVQELTISVTLQPGLYWIGGAVQSAPTTQPNIRTAATPIPPVPLRNGTSLPGAGAAIAGYSASGVSGALPNPFGTPGSAGTVPRLLLRTA